MSLRSALQSLRSRRSEFRGIAIADILDRLYLEDLSRPEVLSAGPPERVADKAAGYLHRLPMWRLLIARWALGTRSIDEDPLSSRMETHGSHQH